jgi:hypothetical protein
LHIIRTKKELNPQFQKKIGSTPHGITYCFYFSILAIRLECAIDGLPFGLGTDGIGRSAITLPRDLEARLRRDHQPLRLKLEAQGANSGSSDDVVLRSVAPKLVPTAQ